MQWPGLVQILELYRHLGYFDGIHRHRKRRCGGIVWRLFGGCGAAHDPVPVKQRLAPYRVQCPARSAQSADPGAIAIEIEAAVFERQGLQPRQRLVGRAPLQTQTGQLQLQVRNMQAWCAAGHAEVIVRPAVESAGRLLQVEFVPQEAPGQPRRVVLDGQASPGGGGIQRQVTLHRQPPAITKAQGHHLDAGVLRTGAQMLRLQIDRHDVGLGRRGAREVAEVQHAVADRDPLECELPGFRRLPLRGLFRTASRVCDQPCQIKFAIGRNAEMHPWADQSYLREPYLAVQQRTRIEIDGHFGDARERVALPLPQRQSL